MFLDVPRGMLPDGRNPAVPMRIEEKVKESKRRTNFSFSLVLLERVEMRARRDWSVQLMTRKSSFQSERLHR